MRVFTPSSLLRLTLLFSLGAVFFWTFRDHSFADVYSRHSIRVKNWWKLLPKDDSFYRITTKNTDRVYRPSFTSILTGDFSSLAQKCDGHRGHDRSPFPLCAVLNAFRTTTKIRFPSPSLGSAQKLQFPPAECLDREGRWNIYSQLRSHIDLGQAQDQLSQRPAQTAILVRAWDDCGWDPDAINNIRALIVETALSSSAYRVFILFHVRNETLAREYAGRDLDLLRLLKVPEEFHTMTSIWSYADTKEAYPWVGAYDVFFHTYMPVQLFAIRNPTYTSFWNWEFDVRYTGHYGQLLSNIDRYNDGHVSAREHDSRYFDTPLFPISTHPPPLLTRPNTTADLVTFLPMFNVSITEWVWRKYSIHYAPDAFPNALQASVVLTNRLSSRLLYMMHEENLAGRALNAEMFAPTLTTHYNLTHLHVPHPIYFDRVWNPLTIDQVFNRGPNAEIGGALAGVIDQEHHFEGVTWYYASKFAPELYSRWMGWATVGPGSKDWEKKHGRICLPPMLLHPIKAESLRSV